MDSKLGSIVSEKKKPVKLAPEEEDRGGLLIPLYPEPDDSGIDSDDTDAARARRLHLIDVSSSDEEPIAKPPWIRAMKKKNDELLKVMEDEQEPPDMLMPMLPWDYHQQLSHQATVDTNSDRASPPLFEVELTTSDEDDDGSVLELVIPMQHSSRYQRVSTSSPKKSKAKSPKFFYNLLCCMRK